MTREDALQELGDILDECDGDPETAHINADQVLCDLLSALGYDEVVDAWQAVDKWYA